MVQEYQGSGKNLLINTIGTYSASRPLVGTTPLTLDIQTDGDWSVAIDPIARAGSAAFSGTGDSVSGIFDPPKSGAWQIAHSGTSNFVVQLRCAGGNNLVQNEIGVVQASKVVTFGRGPCYWEVQADGNWSLNPR